MVTDGAGAAIIGRVTPTPAFTTDSRLAGRLSALASLGAAIIHFAVAPAHWQEWIPSGLFFVSLALFQLLWAAMAFSRLTTPVLITGVMINVGVIGIWAVSRIAGSPFGPHAGTAEVVKAADLCALLLQVYVVMGAAWVWHRGHHGDPIPAYATAFIVLGAGTVVGLASTVGVASGMQHGHHGPTVAEVDHHGPAANHEQHH
ncbi:hypothetical protein C6A85_99040, partial [Mycobacterium sp. ITM-2017-0098]